MNSYGKSARHLMRAFSEKNPSYALIFFPKPDRTLMTTRRRPTSKTYSLT